MSLTFALLKQWLLLKSYQKNLWRKQSRGYYILWLKEKKNHHFQDQVLSAFQRRGGKDRIYRRFGEVMFKVGLLTVGVQSS